MVGESPLKGVPDQVELAHFNALRGQDRWREAMWFGLVGRSMPSGYTLRDLAAVIDGVPAAEADFTADDAVWPDAADPEREWVRTGTVPKRENALEQALLESICDDELAQAIGRLRLVRRALENVSVNVLTSHPVPGVAVNDLMKKEEMMKDHDAEALAAARGIVVWPDAKGRWEVLAAIVGTPAQELKDAAVWRRKTANARDGNGILKSPSKCCSATEETLM